jgi:uncharacterized protein
MGSSAMNMPHVTSVFAALCALLQVGLTAYVIVRRAQTNIDFLDGGDPHLLRRIRAHGNFIETAPMALLLMLILECNGLATAWIWAIGVCLVLGRVMHALSILTDNAAWSRRGGMSLTLLLLSTQAVLCLRLFLR